MTSAKEMFHQLFTPENRSRSAKTVETFGWLILVEGTDRIILSAICDFRPRHTTACSTK